VCTQPNKTLTQVQCHRDQGDDGEYPVETHREITDGHEYVHLAVRGFMVLLRIFNDTLIMGVGTVDGYIPCPRDCACEEDE
jgi:hypothetical protein